MMRSAFRNYAPPREPPSKITVAAVWASASPATSGSVAQGFFAGVLPRGSRLQPRHFQLNAKRTSALEKSSSRPIPLHSTPRKQHRTRSKNPANETSRRAYYPITATLAFAFSAVYFFPHVQTAAQTTSRLHLGHASLNRRSSPRKARLGESAGTFNPAVIFAGDHSSTSSLTAKIVMLYRAQDANRHFPHRIRRKLRRYPLHTSRRTSSFPRIRL